jgi:hypothetical protein
MFKIKQRYSKGNIADDDTGSTPPISETNQHSDAYFRESN